MHINNALEGPVHCSVEVGNANAALLRSAARQLLIHPFQAGFLLLSMQESCVRSRYVGLHLVHYLPYSGVTLHMVFAEVTQASICSWCFVLEVVE